MMVYCVFSLESPHQGDSNEYTCHLLYKKRKSPKIITNLHGMSSLQGTQNEFEIAVVNEPSVFEPLKFYCMCFTVVSFNNHL